MCEQVKIDTKDLNELWNCILLSLIHAAVCFSFYLVLFHFLKSPGHCALKQFQSSLMDNLTYGFKNCPTGEPNAYKAALPLGSSGWKGFRRLSQHVSAWYCQPLIFISCIFPGNSIRDVALIRDVSMIP